MTEPRIVTLDLEFLASKTYKGDLKIAPGYIICACIKDLNVAKVKTISMLSHPGKTPTDDKRIVYALHEELQDVDMFVVQYGLKIDIPFVQTKFLQYGLSPLPLPVNVVDTCMVARSKLAMKSNSLAALAQFFKLPKQKMPVTEEQWYQAFAGDKKVMKLVEQRCASDVILTEMVYHKLLPVMHTHPCTAPLGTDRTACQVCGKHTLTKAGVRLSVKQRFQRYRCANCGHNSQKLLSQEQLFAKV